MNDKTENNETAPETPPKKKKHRLLWVLGCFVAGLLLIQLIPYGHNHKNPPVKTKPAWASAKVQHLATIACADCHSNNTRWPWYTNVAPISWLVMFDVQVGRRRLNWSEGCASPDDIGESVNRNMPPIQYTIKHTDARLSKADKKILADGLPQSIANAPGVWHECGDGGRG